MSPQGSQRPYGNAHKTVAVVALCFVFFAVGRWLLPHEARGLVVHSSAGQPGQRPQQQKADGGGGGGGGELPAWVPPTDLKEVPQVNIRAQADRLLQLKLLLKANQSPLAKCRVFPLFFQGMSDGQAVQVLMNSTRLGGQVVWANATAVPCSRGGAQRCCAWPFSYRFGATDFFVFQQIYRDHFLRALYALFPPGTEPKYILDAGANAGFSTSLFKLIFPDATVVSLEPDPTNFAALQRNTQRFSKVHAVNGGLWGRTANITLAGSTKLGQEWGKVFREARPGEDGIPAYSVNDVAKMFDIPRFDYVKIDIEGAEAAVFGPDADMSWVGQPPVVSLEVHDFFASRFGVTAVSGRVDAAFAGKDYVVAADNEHIFYLSPGWLSSLGLKPTSPEEQAAGAGAAGAREAGARRLLRG